MLDYFQNYFSRLKSCCQDDKSFVLRLEAAQCVSLRLDPYHILGEASVR